MKVSKYKALPCGLWYVAKGKATTLDVSIRGKERGEKKEN